MWHYPRWWVDYMFFLISIHAARAAMRTATIQTYDSTALMLIRLSPQPNIQTC